MSGERIFLSSPTMHGEEQLYINLAFEKNWIAPLGFNCDGFEEEMIAYVSESGVRTDEQDLKQKFHALAVSSGTAAIHLAVKLAGVKPGDIVFCSDMTFAATVNPIIYEGGVPVFIDSERDTWNMCPEALEKAFEKYPNTKAVVLVHLYGVPAKIDEIREICERYHAILIEDAAEALAASYKGEHCGTFGEYGTFSFNGNKIITTSGGGMLITNSKDKRDKALFWATQSREDEPWYQHKEIGYNYRMSNVVAGIGRGQLIYLDEHRERKRQIYHRYETAFQDLSVQMNPYLVDTRPNFWLSCMLINSNSNVRFMDIIHKLQENNIESRPIWKPMHMQPVFEDNDFIYIEEIPVDEDIFQRGICLPSDIKMTVRQQDRVIQIIRSCFEQEMKDET